MIDSSSNFRLGGFVELSDSSGWITFEDTTAEGTVDGGRFSIDSLRINHDSIAFTFAPAQVTVSGRCESEDSVRGRFAYPNWDPPPTGVWEMHRVQQNQ